MNRKKFLGLTTTWEGGLMRIRAGGCGLGSYDVIIRGVNGAEETSRAPSTSEHDDGFLFGIERELGARRTITLGVVVEDAAATDKGDEGCAAENLEEASPF